MDAGVGWIAAIIIGGIAGWLAEQFMKSDMGLLMNIVLGIVGAAIASAILSVFGIALGGWLGYLIVGFIGACLLIWIVRMVPNEQSAVRSFRKRQSNTKRRIRVRKSRCSLSSCSSKATCGVADRTETNALAVLAMRC